MKKIRLAVREFATPIRPKGHYMGTPSEGALNLGVQIHQQIQERHDAHPGFRSEVFLSGVFPADKFEFHVSGRADGVFAGQDPLIEEIKSTSRITALQKELEADDEHPYLLQVRLYCWFYEDFYGKTPQGQIRLVSTRNGEERLIPVSFDPQEFKSWTERKVEALVLQELDKQKSIKRRKKLAPQLVFPFPQVRPGQDDLMSEVRSAMSGGSRLLVQAPTGIGKTLGVLFPALCETLSRGAQLFYVTPKNSQFQVVREAIEAMAGVGKTPRTLVLSAKSKICFQKEVHCTPEACTYSRDFFDKVHQENLVDKLKRKSLLDYGSLRRLGEEHGACPYALSHQALAHADLIVCDYNYVFSPGASLSALFQGVSPKSQKCSLVIDEAHNLFERAREYYSPSISVEQLSEYEKRFDELPHRPLELCTGLFAEIRSWIASYSSMGSGKNASALIDLKLSEVLRLEGRTVEVLTEMMTFEGVNAEFIATILGTFSQMRDILQSGSDNFIKLYLREWGFEGIKIKCLDAAPFLEATYGEFHSVVAFSATVKPFEFFRQVSGLGDSTRFREFPSSFPPENRKVLVIPQVSTAYRERERNYPKIAEVISRIASSEPGHYVVFFTSYAFLEKVFELLEPEGFEVIAQSRNLTRRQVEEITERLQGEGDPCVLMAVQGGVLAEGVDFQGEQLRGVLVVGPGMPSFDFEREQLREYYERHYQKGFAYAYTYPAMIRSIQAAGRLIRSEHKRGLLVFLDRRFVQDDFAQLFPAGWYQQSVQELVSSEILKDIDRFWSGPDGTPTPNE